ncbi:SAVED domain-containing protein [Bacillus salipaludis]|uniref:SAVED domain-containing protein n=1 Tax=Bacillus salipaludis TaxID=2547811 RepID=A0A4R5VK40_9BACI|nr:SAVED domain-containing protein [Bacillus salipaludis]TDK58120.1 SAVED domain-containing protein [Bacillus salipaludis]
MKLIQKTINLLQLVINHLLASVILMLILFFMIIITYKKFGWIQAIFNLVTNWIWFIKKEYVLLANFSKKDGHISAIKNKYQEQGCLYLINNFTKKFSHDGVIDKNALEEIIFKQIKTVEKAKKRVKKSNSLIYLGFPHVPLGFLDGRLYKDLDGAILYEYQGMESETLGKGFYELNKKYNTEMELFNNRDKYEELEKEIALKIEQSFPIQNEDIKKTVKVSQILSFGISKPNRWKINNYAQIERYQTEFEKLLKELKENGVEKIHLFATTPVSLSFSLGRVIQHYHPEIIIYNYNNNRFDWGINLNSKEVIFFT